MNKKIFFQIIFLFATTLCFAQNETTVPETADSTKIETLGELTPAPFEENETAKSTAKKMVDSLAHAPEQKLEIKDFQITLLTPLGTNGTNASNCSNKVSLNIFGGINGGLDGVEFGGFANVLKHNGKGLQAVGFANVVRGDFDGIQGAGFTNVIRKKMKGVQASGFVNTALGGLDGIQATGFSNVSRGYSEGVQLAGFTNTALGGIDGFQGAGFANIATGNSKGVQVAGFLNVAKNMDGLQIGFINVADTLDGLAIGFFSFARNGYHTLEASTNETFQANLTFKTGSNRYFYNIFSTGIRFSNFDNGDNYQWAFGYGAGTNFRLSRKMNINADAISYAIIPRRIDRNFDEDDFGTVGKLNLGLSYKVAKHFTIFGGPTLNVLVNQNQSFIDNINPVEIFTATDDDVNVIVYPGFHIGVRI